MLPVARPLASRSGTAPQSSSHTRPSPRTSVPSKPSTARFSATLRCIGSSSGASARPSRDTRTPPSPAKSGARIDSVSTGSIPRIFAKAPFTRMSRHATSLAMPTPTGNTSRSDCNSSTRRRSSWFSRFTSASACSRCAISPRRRRLLASRSEVRARTRSSSDSFKRRSSPGPASCKASGITRTRTAAVANEIPAVKAFTEPVR